MYLTELYPLVRTSHISLVLLSGALFAARGIGVQCNARWSMAPAVRILSYSIDTALLGAALLLLYLLGLNPFAVPWLTTKLCLLLLYIVLGSLALKRAPGLRWKRRFLAAALLCYGFMLSVATSHHPWGWLVRLAG